MSVRMKVLTKFVLQCIYMYLRAFQMRPIFLTFRFFVSQQTALVSRIGDQFTPKNQQELVQIGVQS